MGQKVRESVCICILDDSIFVRIQPQNRYSKNVKKGNVSIKGLIVYSRLNYCKVKITESSETEWNKITRESLEDKQESLKVK